MEVCCRQLFDKINQHLFDEQLQLQCKDFIKQYPDQAPRFLEKMGRMFPNPNEKKCVMLLTYALPLIQLTLNHRQLYEETEIVKIADLWFDQMWTFRSSSLMELQARVRDLVGLLIPIYPKYSGIILKEFVYQPMIYTRGMVSDLLMQFARTNPQQFYDEMDKYLAAEPIQEPSGVLMLLGMLLKHRKYYDPQEFLASSLWKSVLSLLKCTEDNTILTIGLWVLCLVVPHILRSLADYLLDFLYIVKRAMIINDRSNVIDRPVSKEPLMLEETTVEPGMDDVYASKMDYLESIIPNVQRVSFCDIWRKSKPLGKSSRTSSSRAQQFQDLPSCWCRLRRLEIWHGTDKSGKEVITGLRVTAQNLSGIFIQYPLRGEATGAMQVWTCSRGEFITKIDASWIRTRHLNPTSATSPASADVVSAIRITTNFSTYPWIGQASRHPDLDSTLISPIDGSNDLEEIIGFYGSFDDGLRSLGAYFVPADIVQQPANVEVMVEGPNKHCRRYLTYLFRCLYAIFPWHCVRFVHDECSGSSPEHNRIKAVARTIMQDLKVHPDITQTADEELLALQWQLVSPEAFLLYVNSLECRSSIELEGEMDASGGPSIEGEDVDKTLQAIELSFNRYIARSYRRSLSLLRGELVKTDVAKEETDALKHELERQGEITKTMQEMIDRHRVQMQSFEKEQKKWQLELHLKISKYAHERKRLSEQNLALQEQIRFRDEQLVQLRHELYQQASMNLEVEAALNYEKNNAKKYDSLEKKNQSLTEEVIQWEHYHKTRVEKLLSLHLKEKDLLIDRLTKKLVSIDVHGEELPESCVNVESNETAQATTEKVNHQIADLEFRLLELETANKQKDQTNFRLKKMIERHQLVSEEKLNAISDKYEHVKAANLALQKRAMELMEELEQTQQ